MPLKVKSPFSLSRRRGSARGYLVIGDNRAVFYLAFFVALFFFTAGCAERKIEDAFQGKLSAKDSNKVINEYCKSCHIHKNFDPAGHMASVRNNYKRTYFKRARECRACHYIEKNWVTNNYHRKTRDPRNANRGVYRNFEHAEIKQMKKNRPKKN